jgi:DDE superfamily endonuclease
MDGHKGPLVVLEYPGGKGGGMNSEWYCEQVLKGCFYDYWMTMTSIRGQISFQQDGAASHTSKSTKQWLQQNSIPIFPHPAASPDLNPIEPVWKILKTKIRTRPHPPTSMDELKQAVKQAWDAISDEDIHTHTKHMEDRVKAVINARGGHTKY